MALNSKLFILVQLGTAVSSIFLLGLPGRQGKEPFLILRRNSIIKRPILLLRYTSTRTTKHTEQVTDEFEQSF